MAIWRSENYNNVSAKDRVPDINLTQLKLKLNDTYKKDEKSESKFEPSHEEDIKNRAYLDKNLSEGTVMFQIEKKIIMKLKCSATNSLWKRC